MDNNEFSRLNSFLETEREKSYESNETVTTTMTTSKSTSRASLQAINYPTVNSLTEIFNSSSMLSSKPPTPPPRRKKSIRKMQEQSKVQKIASRFENIQLQYQNGHNMKYNESFEVDENISTTTSDQTSETEETISISSTSTISIPQTPLEYSETVSLNSPLPETKNISTVFRFKDASHTLPRPKTDEKRSLRNAVKFNSFQPGQGDDVDVATTEPETEIQYRSKEELIPKEVKPIIDELISTEETYVENLKRGLENYEPMFDRIDLPPGLRGKKFVLMGNIEQLLEFHETQFLPMLKKERHDITRLFNEFVRFLDEHYFYSYVIYTMNKKRSLQLCDIHKQYFKELQEELGDKLGEFPLF